MDKYLDMVIGLLSQGEWKALIFGLILTFAATYILKTIYKAVVNKSKRRPSHVRFAAIFAGFIAAFAVWEDKHAIGLHWYMAGVMLGPMSIALHHIFLGLAANPPVSKFLPWLYPLIKGVKDRRRGGNTLAPYGDNNRRR